MSKLKMSGEEASYYKEGKTPVRATTSLLSSNSKWLNSATLRDLFAQESLRRNGDDIGVLQLVPEVMNEYHRLLDDDEVAKIFQRERERKPEFSAWLDEGKTILVDLDDDDRYAQGTLGALMRDFYRSTGFNQVLAYAALEPTNDYERYTKRRALLHDVEHMVTGFGTDPAGEFGLIYVYLQLNSAYYSPELASLLSFNHAYLSSTWMMRTNLYYPGAMQTFLEAVQVGLDMASRIERPLYLEDWEHHFDYPLEDVQRALNIEPTDPDAWAFTEKAWRG